MEMEECNTTLCLAIGPSPTKVPIDLKKHVDLNEMFTTQFKQDRKPDKIRKLRSDSYTDSDGESNSSVKKKLRLSKEQFTLLENVFQERNTLNPILKEELAYRLGLRTRQIEVWFQNRRARNKMKQTEASKEILKQQCEKIRIENQRMKKELHDLKLMTQNLSFHCHYGFQKHPTLNICRCLRPIKGENN